MVESFTEDDIAREMQEMLNEKKHMESAKLSTENLNEISAGIAAPPKRRGPPIRKSSTKKLVE